jgi:hypothetical protein
LLSIPLDTISPDTPNEQPTTVATPEKDTLPPQPVIQEEDFISQPTAPGQQDSLRTDRKIKALKKQQKIIKRTAVYSAFSPLLVLILLTTLLFVTFAWFTNAYNGYSYNTQETVILILGILSGMVFVTGELAFWYSLVFSLLGLNRMQGLQPTPEHIQLKEDYLSTRNWSIGGAVFRFILLTGYILFIINQYS